MLLKKIGAYIIVAGIVFGVIAINLSRSLGHDSWIYRAFPLIMFLLFVVGASIGVAGMIVTAIQRRRKSSN